MVRPRHEVLRRFKLGRVGSFVSADGLVMTNHHVGADALEKMSDEKNNYLQGRVPGQDPRRREKCLDLELNVLQSIEDVTTRVNAAVKPDMKSDEAFKARRGIIAQIEKESSIRPACAATSLLFTRAGVPPLSLEEIHRHSARVRPGSRSRSMAATGQLRIPAHDLDVCFFRVYEDGKPVKCEHYLKWSQAGEGGRTGVRVRAPGTPTGRTRWPNWKRCATFEFRFTCSGITGWKSRCGPGASGARKRPPGPRFPVQCAEQPQGPRRRLAGLLDPGLMARKQSDEAKMRARSPPTKLKDAAGAGDKIAAAEDPARSSSRRCYWNAAAGLSAACS